MKNTATGFVTHSKERMYIVGRKKTIRHSDKILEIQSANDIEVSDVEAKVCIKELGAYLWIHSVKDSPSVQSLGHCAMNLVILIRG